MNYHYEDIRSRIAEEPTWWDESAVPRYCAFSPSEIANIYAKEVVLLRIACQACGRTFDVCVSWSAMDQVYKRPAPSENVRSLSYGDPPNVDCCPAGPTMSSDTLRVLQFWRQAPFDAEPDAPRWQRVPDLEVVIDPDWVD